ncbi:54S ribosomal protein L3 mitochondrial, partial [Kickxella alabastrina]
MLFSITRTTSRLASASAASISVRRAALSTFTSRKAGKPAAATAEDTNGAATYAALEARLNLQFKDRSLMELVCTHTSHEQGREGSNERLQWLGKRVLNLVVGEYLYAKYPNLPAEALQDVQHGSFGMASLAEVGRHFGMQPALRWTSVTADQSVGVTKVLGKAVQALVGAVYADQGAAAARQF